MIDRAIIKTRVEGFRRKRLVTRTDPSFASASDSESEPTALRTPSHWQAAFRQTETRRSPPPGPARGREARTMTVTAESRPTRDNDSDGQSMTMTSYRWAVSNSESSWQWPTADDRGPLLIV